MAKKYSVEVENDRLISVEVDGTRYADPDEIPDERDRQKIRDLLAGMQAAGDPDDLLDKAFEQRFAADLRELEKPSTVFPRLIIAIFLGIGALLLIISFLSTVSTVQTLSREVSVPGEVIALARSTSRDSETGGVTVYFHPVVEYVPAGKTALRVQMDEGSTTPDYAPGDAVTVLYDSVQPNAARIKSFSSGPLMWLLPGITFLVGAVFAGVGAAIFKLWPPHRQKSILHG